MMIKKEFYIPSADGVHRLHVILWEPDTEVKGVVQISHGMIEMIERYEDFALFLNRHGYAVIGNDHLGHGLTAGNNSDLGYFCPRNMSAIVVADLHRVTRCARKKYKNVPYFMFGHSMGSFMVRRYLMRYGMDVDGAILSGTGGKSNLVLVTGKIVSNVFRLVLGDRYRSRLLKMNAFGAYQKRKTHNPSYRNAVSELLRGIIADNYSPLLDFIRKDKLNELLLTDKSEPWYGQLMTTPQTIAYFVQFNYWLRKFNVRFE